MRLLLAPALIVSVLTSGFAAPAEAQAVAQRRSHAVQCLMAMSAASGSTTNPTARDAAKIGMLFFGAQLSGIDPDLDLTAAVRAELPSLNRDKLQALIPQCGAEIHAKERQIAQIGAGLRQGQGQKPNQHQKQEGR